MVYWDDSLFFIPPLQRVKIVRVNVWRCYHLQLVGNVWKFYHLQLAFSPMSNTGRLTAVVHQGDLGKKEVNWAIRHCLSFKCVETSNFVQIADDKIQHHDSKMIPEYKGLCPLPEQAFQSSLYSGLGPPWKIWGRLKKKAKVFFTSLSIPFQRAIPVQVAGWQNHLQWSQGDPPDSPSHAWLV